MIDTSVNTLNVRNSEAEAALAFGVAEIVEAEALAFEGESGTEDGETITVIRKPTGSGLLVAIGPVDIPAGGYGVAYTGRPHVRFNGADPSPGDTLQAKAGQWEAEAAGGGTSAPVEGDVRTLGTAPDDFKICRVVIGEGGGGSSLTLRHGVVRQGNAATWNNGGNALEAGDVEVWEWSEPTSLDNHDETISYSTGDTIYLTAADYDESTQYSEGDTVLYEDAGPPVARRVYRAPNGSIPPGPFNAGVWTLLDTEGPYVANQAIPASTIYDSGMWDELNVNSRHLERSNEIDLLWWFTFDPVPGSQITWVAETGDILVVICTELEGWA